MLALQPNRWKVFQALVLAGVNDRKRPRFAVSDAAFRGYLNRHRNTMRRIPTFVEDNRLMTASYLMVDPKGRVYDNSEGRIRYSDPVPQIGLKTALTQVCWAPDRFHERSRSVRFVGDTDVFPKSANSCRDFSVN